MKEEDKLLTKFSEIATILITIKADLSNDLAEIKGLLNDIKGNIGSYV